MQFKILFSLLAVTILFSSCSPKDEQIEAWVNKNPDKIMKALMDYQRKMQEDSQPKPEDVKNNSGALFENAGSPSLGNGPITLAYFFDFNCGHCAKQSETLKDVLSKKTNIKVIFKNFAVLGPSSELAAKAALSAHLQGKYYEFYSEALKIREKNPETLKTIAKKIGLNVVQWEKDLENENVKKEIDHVAELAHKMKIGGTPAIAIAPDKIFPGRVDQLLQVIESIEKN